MFFFVSDLLMLKATTKFHMPVFVHFKIGKRVNFPVKGSSARERWSLPTAQGGRVRAAITDLKLTHNAKGQVVLDFSVNCLVWKPNGLEIFSTPEWNPWNGEQKTPFLLYVRVLLQGRVAVLLDWQGS